MKKIIDKKYWFAIQILFTLGYVGAFAYDEMGYTWTIIPLLIMVTYWVMFTNILTEAYRAEFKGAWPPLRWAFKCPEIGWI